MREDEKTQKLTAAMAAGDARGVETFYRRYFDWLYAQARRASRRDEAFCLDVVQEAVLRIIRTIRPVRNEAQLFAWMRLVVQTTALDQLRHEKRRQKRAVALVPAESTRPEDAPFDESQYEWLRGKLSRFDPELVHMIELRYEHRWTLARIGKALGFSIGTIDGRLRRAFSELRRQAIEEFDE